MNGITGWIKEHPLLTGGLALAIVFLFLAIRNASSGGTQVVSSGPSDAVTEANIAAGVANTQAAASVQAQSQLINASLANTQITTNAQLSAINTQAQSQTDQTQLVTGAQTAQDQIAAAAGVTMAQISAATTSNANLLQFQASTAETAAAETIAEAGDSANVDIAGLQFGSANTIAGIQAGVAINASNNDLASQQDQDNAAIQINGQNTSTAQILANLQSGVSLANIAANLTAAENLNQTNLAIVNSNNATTQQVTQITTNGSVSLATIAAGVQDQANQDITDLTAQENNIQGGLTQSLIYDQNTYAENQLNASSALSNSILDAFKGVNFNLGGEGGANVLAAWTTLLGNPAAGIAAEQGAAATSQANSIGSILAGIGNLFKGAGAGAIGVGVGAGTAGLAH